MNPETRLSAKRRRPSPPASVRSSSKKRPPVSSAARRKYPPRRPPSVWKRRPKPKRPLSAFNLFFARERERILKGGGSDAGPGGAAGGVHPSDDADTAGSLLDRIIENKGRLSSKSESESDGEDGPKQDPEGPGDDAERRSSLSWRSARTPHGKISFEDLARTISKRWRALDESSRGIYEALALLEKRRYERECDAWDRERVAEAERLLAEQKAKDRAEARRKARMGTLAEAAAPQSASLPNAKDPTRNKEEVEILKELKAPQESAQTGQEKSGNQDTAHLASNQMGLDNFSQSLCFRNLGAIGLVEDPVTFSSQAPSQENMPQHILAQVGIESILKNEQTGSDSSSLGLNSKPPPPSLPGAIQVTDSLLPPQPFAASFDGLLFGSAPQLASIPQGGTQSPPSSVYDSIMRGPSPLSFGLDLNTCLGNTQVGQEPPAKRQRTGELTPPGQVDSFQPHPYDDLFSEDDSATTNVELPPPQPSPKMPISELDGWEHIHELLNTIPSIVPPTGVSWSPPMDGKISPPPSAGGFRAPRSMKSSCLRPRRQPFPSLQSLEDEDIDSVVSTPTSKEKGTFGTMGLDEESVDFLVSVFQSN